MHWRWTYCSAMKLIKFKHSWSILTFELWQWWDGSPIPGVMAFSFAWYWEQIGVFEFDVGVCVGVGAGVGHWCWCWPLIWCCWWMVLVIGDALWCWFQTFFLVIGHWFKHILLYMKKYIYKWIRPGNNETAPSPHSCNIQAYNIKQQFYRKWSFTSKT